MLHLETAQADLKAATTLQAAPGSTIEFGRVLALRQGEEFSVGEHAVLAGAQASRLLQFIAVQHWCNLMPAATRQSAPRASGPAAGQPYLENVKVQAQIVEELKGKKVIVYKMRPKKHYQKKNGHRQPLTKFMVTKISKA